MHTYALDGYTVTVELEPDDCSAPPWEAYDGHGPVSAWTRRDKAPGERVLYADHGARLLYDHAGAVRIARRDGWDTPPYGTGTAGERAERAAHADYEYLRRWCEGRWWCVTVCVTVTAPDGERVDCDSCGGVESEGDYWREVANALAGELIARHRTEMTERAHWAARGLVTA